MDQRKADDAMRRQLICWAFTSKSSDTGSIKERYCETNEDFEEDWGIVDKENPSY